MQDLPVFISGASSGIGRACAVFLSRNGFKVFAGVRKESDGNILQKNAPVKIETPVWKKGLNSFNEAMNKSDSEVSCLYRSLNNQLIKYSLNSNGIPSDKVADLVHRILISKKPKNRYLLGKDAIFLKLISYLPGRIRDRIILAVMKI